MKKILSLSMLLVFVASSAFAQKRHNEIEYPEINRFVMPNVTTFELRNGIKFFLVEDSELPLISLSMVVRAGSYMDPDDKVGLASLTGELIRSGGSQKHPYAELNRLLENRAASMETSFGLTSGGASMSLLKEDFDDLLPVFLDLIQNPAFPEDRISLAKTQRNSLIGRRNDNAGQVASREFQKLIYGANSPFARSTEYATIDAITREDMIAFHKNVMTGRNMLIGVIGDFNTRDMRRKLERAFGSIPAGTRNPLNLPPVNYEFKNEIHFVAKNDVNQSNIRIGHIGGRRSNPDFAAIQLMNEILSGGFSGRLMNVIRTDLGLAYDAGGAYQSNALYNGIFFVTLSTASATTAKAVEATIGELRRIQQEPVTQTELDDAKDRILNSLVFRYQSRSSVLFEQINNEYNGLPADAFNRYIDDLRKVTVADIQRVAKQYLRPDQLQVLIVGNENEMGDQLASLGEVNRIDITIPRPVVARQEVTGDATEGRNWLQRMSNALIADGVSFTKITYEGKENQGGMALDAKTSITFPTAIVQELTLPQGQIRVSIENGVGKMSMGPNEQQLPAAQVEAQLKQLERHYLNIALNAGEVSVEFLGAAEDDENLVKLYLPDTNTTYYLDSETALPVKSVVKEFNAMMGQEVEVTIKLSEWTEAQGVKMAYKSEVLVGGQAASSSIVTSHEIE